MFFTAQRPRACHPHRAVAATRASEPAPGARSECRAPAEAIVPRARSVETASVRGAVKNAHLFSSNGQHEAASTPSVQAGAAFEFGLLMLVTRTRGCEGIGRRITHSVAQRVAVRRLPQDPLLLLVPVALVALLPAPLLLLVERLVLAVLALRGAAALRDRWWRVF